ncbi:MAG: carboxyvinyl-carboxyphosphonate phosphorylmutase [Acidimicrobiia bacterium]|nr:carboxyvinyl-carboxyphosphonate phosphorylmutase [Acidimicrobiia bacterium]
MTVAPASPGARLRARLATGELLVLPGAPNALTARVIEDCGFDAAYVTGAGVANTFLGVADIGLLSVGELVDHVAAMAAAVALPLVVDADTGFGGPLNVARTVRSLERAGAAAIQLEDQTFPKRCGHFAGTEVVPRQEMLGKLRAAVDARESADLVIVARTDARAGHGLDEACERANGYREAGADVLFVEALRSVAEVEEVPRRVPGPLLVNLVEGGVTPALPAARLEALGYSIALHANLALLASVGAMQAVLGELRASREVTETRGVLASWEERQRLVRRQELDDLGARYEPGPAEPGSAGAGAVP